METSLALKNFVITPMALLGVCLGISLDVPDVTADMERIGQSKILASDYFNKEEAGTPTASGELYNPKSLTAAHRSLPFGTLVRVSDPTTHKSAVVRINDRGPIALDHDIDLSEAAASRLELTDHTVRAVIVTVLRQP